MSAPVVQSQNKIRIVHQHIWILKEEGIMKLATEIIKAKKWMSGGLATQHPAKLVVGLVLGAVFLAGTALHFGPNNADEVGSGFSSDRGESSSVSKVQPAVERDQSKTETHIVTQVGSVDEGHTAFLHRGQNSGKAAGFSPMDQIKRMEDQIDSMLAHAARNPSTVSPRLNREIERLDYAIDMMLADATHDPSADNSLDREIDRLEREINVMLSDEAHNPSVNKSQINRQIERLDYQIDMMLMAAMLEQ